MRIHNQVMQQVLDRLDVTGHLTATRTSGTRSESAVGYVLRVMPLWRSYSSCSLDSLRRNERALSTYPTMFIPPRHSKVGTI